MGNNNTKEIEVEPLIAETPISAVDDLTTEINTSPPIPIKKKYKHAYQEEHSNIFDEPTHDNFFKFMRLAKNNKTIDCDPKINDDIDES